MLFLILVHVVVLDDEIKGSQQEAAGAAGRIANGVVGSRFDAIDDRLNQLARREVLPRAPLVGQRLSLASSNEQTL